MFRIPFRHVASDVLHDLITAFLVAVAALTASGLLDRNGMRSDSNRRELGVIRDHSASAHARGPRRLAGSTQRGARPAVDSNGRLMAVTAA